MLEFETDQYSKKTQALLTTLSTTEKQQIKKDNPYTLERNALIVKLRAKGASTTALAELVGVSQTSICKILKSRTKATKAKESVPILNVDFHPVLMLLINDILREKHKVLFDTIKYYPQDYQEAAIDRFLLIRTFEDYFIRAQELVLGGKFQRKPATIDFCEKNQVPLNTFYRWMHLYRKAGIEGLTPRYLHKEEKGLDDPIEKKPRSKKKS